MSNVKGATLGVALLLAFAAVLPTELPEAAPTPTSEDCLAVSESTQMDGPSRLALLEGCSVLFPEDVELLADLGDEYARGGKLTAAEGAYQRALNGDSQYADVRLRLGRLMLKRGDAAAARQQAEAALQVQPNRAALLALLHDATDKSEGAPRQ